MITPSMVSTARILFARSACMASDHVSLQKAAEFGVADIRKSLAAGGVRQLLGFFELREAALRFLALWLQLQCLAILLGGVGSLALQLVEAAQPLARSRVLRPIA